ncbi:hypothetical protein D3C71_22480 [compost metagenome]
MQTRSKLFGLLTTPQAELLKTLFELEEQTRAGRYWRPRDLGGYRSSHHALTLRKLCEHGLVERDETQHNFGYRIASAGQSMWRLLQASSQLPAAALLGGAAARPRAEALMRLAA